MPARYPCRSEISLLVRPNCIGPHYFLRREITAINNSPSVTHDLKQASAISDNVTAKSLALSVEPDARDLWKGRVSRTEDAEIAFRADSREAQ